MVKKWIEKAQGSQVDRLGPHQLAQMINKWLSCARVFDLICCEFVKSNVGVSAFAFQQCNSGLGAGPQRVGVVVGVNDRLGLRG